MSLSVHPFHLAFPVRDLARTRAFYLDVLGCREGRSAERWVDFDFLGHQLSAHLCDDEAAVTPTNAVDGDNVPVRHFGCVLDMPSWQAMAERLKAQGVSFLIEPHLRFQGEVGEQATLFVLDPDGHAIELKAFADKDKLFARE